MKMKIGVVVAAALLAAPVAVQAQSAALPGFYIGAQGGLNILDTRINGLNEKLGFAVGGVIGYDFVGPRVEIEGVYRYNKVSGASVNQYGGMLNVLYDFMADSVISPHLGLGAGVNYLSIPAAGKTTKFAMQFIAGVKVGLGDGLFTSLDYKLHDTFVSGKDPLNHSVMLTLGYKFGQPMTASPPPPPPPVAPSYIVFFDFDRANITPQAMTTIKQAAAAATAGKKTRIGVTGHADRSGNDAYNMALSLRRANAVKDALVREGIPAANIAVVGRGESQPLVQTADGVREPQNRRVEIVLN
ncbi:MAG: OmpA family protein [Rhodospirillales bacterium]|nr:MAG: OmpA family protein [Rhodospirillales bacterium]